VTNFHGGTAAAQLVSSPLAEPDVKNATILTAGMTGFVKPPDVVRHKTGAGGAKTVVVWVPGDEAAKITAHWAREK
jgi:hypothetical protein